MAPDQIDAHYENESARRKVVYKFKVEDTARISRTEDAFRKGYEGGWSREVFIVKNCYPTDPPTYSIKRFFQRSSQGKILR